MTNYSFIDYQPNVPCPPRKVNGGLYTGEAAYGPWTNYPVVPNTDTWSQNLISAEPPPGVEKFAISFERPGNNHVNLPYYKQLSPLLPVKCVAK